MEEGRRLGLLQALLVVQAHMLRLGVAITVRHLSEPEEVRHANGDHLWDLAGYEALAEVEAELIAATRPTDATIH